MEKCRQEGSGISRRHHCALGIRTFALRFRVFKCRWHAEDHSEWRNAYEWYMHRWKEGWSCRVFFGLHTCRTQRALPCGAGFTRVDAARNTLRRSGSRRKCICEIPFAFGFLYGTLPAIRSSEYIQEHDSSSRSDSFYIPRNILFCALRKLESRNPRIRHPNGGIEGTHGIYRSLSHRIIVESRSNCRRDSRIYRQGG